MIQNRRNKKENHDERPGLKNRQPDCKLFLELKPATTYDRVLAISRNHPGVAGRGYARGPFRLSATAICRCGGG
jgi:hypothetical protein